MRRSIWKWALELTPIQSISLPKGHKILSLQMQKDTPCIWALCDLTAPQHRVWIIMRGTGFEFDFDSDEEYIGTVQQGIYVWHFFKKEGMENVWTYEK